MLSIAYVFIMKNIYLKILKYIVPIKVTSFSLYHRTAKYFFVLILLWVALKALS